MLFKAPLLLVATMALGALAGPAPMPVDSVDWKAVVARGDYFQDEARGICYCGCKRDVFSASAVEETSSLAKRGCTKGCCCTCEGGGKE
jgi:hypothetical protein